MCHGTSIDEPNEILAQKLIMSFRFKIEIKLINK